MSKKAVKVLSGVMAVFFLFAVTAGCSGSKDISQDSNKPAETLEEKEGQPTGEEAELQAEEPAYDFGGRVMKFVAAWTLEPEPGSSEYADKMIARMADLEKKYNFKTEYLNIEMSQLLEQFTASVLAGDPVGDIVYVWSYWFYPSFVSAGMVYPVSDLGIFDFTEEKWNQDVIKFGTYQGKVYGFDTGKTYPRGAIFWNKNIFERDGLPNLYELQNNRTWTWDKLLEIAQKATKDLDGDGVIDQWGLGGVSTDMGILFSNNAEVVRADENGKPVFTLTEPNAIEALQFYQDLIHKYKVYNLPPDGANWDYPMQQFTDGKLAMMYGEWWMAGGFNVNMSDDYGYVVFPMGPKADQYVVRQSELTFPVIPSTAKKPEEIAIVWDARTDPFPDDDPDAWKEGYEAEARDAETIDTIEMIMNEQISKLDLHRGFRQVEELMWTLMWFIYSGNKTPQVAVEEYAQQAKSILDDVWNEIAQ